GTRRLHRPDIGWPGLAADIELCPRGQQHPKLARRAGDVVAVVTIGPARHRPLDLAPEREAARLRENRHGPLARPLETRYIVRDPPRLIKPRNNLPRVRHKLQT